MKAKKEQSSSGGRRARLRVGGAAIAIVGHVCLVGRLAHHEQRRRWTSKHHSHTSSSTPPDTPPHPHIPRLIHQTYKTTTLPAQWEQTPDAWRRHHPTYNYTLWTDDELRSLIERRYAWLLPTYDNYAYSTQRWDAARYAILHAYGGVYADLDLLPTRPIDGLLAGHDCLLPRTPNVGLTNAFMASAANHPFFLEALRQLPRYAHAWYHVTRHNTILSSTGSTFVWAMFLRWPAGAEQQPAIIAADQWGKTSFCEAADSHRVGATATSPLQHLRGSSWHTWDSRVLLSIYCAASEIVVVFILASAAFVACRWRRRVKLLAVLVVSAAASVLGMLNIGGSMLGDGVGLAETFFFRPYIWWIMG